MTAREAILQRVRTGLGRPAGTPVAPAPPPKLHVPSALTVEDRIARFRAALEALNAKTYRAATPAEVRDQVAQILNGRNAVASNAPFLAECGIFALPRVQSGFSQAPALREACATLDVGITSADFALADTGSLVMFSSPREARMISLLPPCHIAIVPRERILTGLDELLALHPVPSDRSSSMVLITGPSRTADIEQILVRGVHGPGEVHAIVV